MTPIGQIFTDFVVVNTILNNKAVIPSKATERQALLRMTSKVFKVISPMTLIVVFRLDVKQPEVQFHGIKGWLRPLPQMWPLSKGPC